jgi:hypothetical protein
MIGNTIDYNGFVLHVGKDTAHIFKNPETYIDI